MFSPARSSHDARKILAMLGCSLLDDGHISRAPEITRLVSCCLGCIILEQVRKPYSRKDSFMDIQP